MSPRLLYVVGQLRRGGTERQLLYLLSALDRPTFRPELVVWNHEPDAPYAREVAALGVPIHGFAAGWPSREKLLALRKLIRDGCPEVVHSYGFFTNFPVFAAALGQRCLAVGSLRGDFRRSIVQAGRLGGRLSARWPGFQVWNTRTAVLEVKRGPWTPRRVEVVPNGLDLCRFTPVPEPVLDPPIILAVGSLFPVKRWDRLLSAAAAVRQQGYRFRVQLVGDGPLRGDLEAQTAGLQLTDVVSFLGPRDDVGKLLAESAFLMHTSDHEGCPNVVMEAMASGRPVVATDAGDTGELVENGQSGFVVRRQDEAALVARMAELLDDRPLRAAMGAAGRGAAERDFGLDRLVERTLAAYRFGGWRN
jgi:glycosyltransferase involved in cell wall biosynthesis